MTEGERDLEAGTRFGHYRIVARAGFGGMGIVFKARDEKLDRDVALKLLPLEAGQDEIALRRLVQEARAASALSHPSICTVYEVGESAGRPYIAMEWLDGELLSQHIPAHGLPPRTVIQFGSQIADALAHAHEHGVVHRDLKSLNVMLTAAGRVKVLDFGVARRIGPRPGSEGATPAVATTTGTILGTPICMAPEMLRGERADARSDIWALGVLLQEMVTGALPFRGQTEFELGAAILNAAPAPLPTSVPAGLRAIIQRCLEKEPTQRYQQAAEARASLEAVQHGLSGAVAAGPIVPPVTARRGPRSRLLTGTVFLLPILAFLGLALNQGGARDRLFGRANAQRIRSLAVLPLENLSRDPDQGYFADGMTDELITSLANLEGVSVISRTSAMRYKGTKKSIPQIARELGVDAVIEGSALRAGDRVRISAQLIEAASDRHLWARSYERDLRDILALQAEVSEAIAREIRTTLTPAAHARRSRARPLDPEAYEAYLKGRYNWNKRTEPGLTTAIEYLTRSIRIDSSYALAYTALADAYIVLPSHSSRGVAECLPRARAAALRALTLDDDLAEAHAALAAVKANERDWPGAEAEYRRSIELDPNYATAHQWYGELLSTLGRHQEAIAESRRARQLDPISPVINAALGARYAAARRSDEAVAALKEAIQLDPSPGYYYYLADTYLMGDKFAEAIRWFARGDSISGTPAQLCEELRRAFASNGKRGFWRKRLAFSLEPPAAPASEIAGIYAQLGDKEKAFEWLEHAVKEEENKTLFWLNTQWKLDPLHSDPRFTPLLRRVGPPA